MAAGSCNRQRQPTALGRKEKGGTESTERCLLWPGKWPTAFLRTAVRLQRVSSEQSTSLQKAPEAGLEKNREIKPTQDGLKSPKTQIALALLHYKFLFLSVNNVMINRAINFWKVHFISSVNLVGLSSLRPLESSKNSWWQFQPVELRGLSNWCFCLQNVVNKGAWKDYERKQLPPQSHQAPVGPVFI